MNINIKAGLVTAAVIIFCVLTLTWPLIGVIGVCAFFLATFFMIARCWFEDENENED